LWVNEDICPKLEKIRHQIENTTNWKNEEAKYHALRVKLEHLFNSTLPGWLEISDVLESRKCHNFDLPPGITYEMSQQILAIATWQFTTLWKDNQYSKLGMGFFVKELLKRMESRIVNIQNPKYIMYSAHDDSVGPLLATLGVFDGKWPPYRAHAEFELWSNSDSKYFVQLKYNSNVLLLPHCSDVMCPFDEFTTLLKSRIPDYPSVCDI